MTANARWKLEHTTLVHLRFNNNTDADILAQLEGKVKQTELKRLIRLGLEADKKK